MALFSGGGFKNVVVYSAVTYVTTLKSAIRGIGSGWCSWKRERFAESSSSSGTTDSHTLNAEGYSNPDSPLTLRPERSSAGPSDWIRGSGIFWMLPADHIRSTSKSPLGLRRKSSPCGRGRDGGQ